MNDNEKNYFAIKVPKIAKPASSGSYVPIRAYRNGSIFPRTYPMLDGGRIEVTTHSPRDQRLAVWHIKNNLLKECPWIYPEFSYRGEFVEKECRSFLWFDSDAPGRTDCVGAACFFYENFAGDIGTVLVLHWVWVHPFCRRMGLFRDLWHHMESERPWMKAPITEGMIGFLAKQGYETKPNWMRGHGTVPLAKRATA